MEFNKLPEDILRFIGLNEVTFNSLSEEVQQIMVQNAVMTRDAVQTAALEKEKAEAAEAAKEMAEEERQKAEAAKEMAEEERQKANVIAEAASQMVEAANAIAEAASQMAEKERHRADEEQHRADVADRWSRIINKPHELTPVLSELLPTRSENIIQSSKEYLDYSNSLRYDFDNNKLTEDQVKKLLHDFVAEKKKEGDARRKREVRHITKKVISQQVKEKVDKNEQVGFLSKKFYVEDLYDDEIWFDNGFEVPVRIPLIFYINEEMRKMVDEFRSRNISIKNPIFVMTLNAYFVASHRHPSYTQNIVISDSEGRPMTGWYDRFCRTVTDKVRVYLDNDNYQEDVEEDVLNPCITLNLNVYEIRNSKCWWPDGVTKLLELEDFVIFTANDESIDCKQQCVEHLGYVYDSSVPLERNFGGKTVIVYQPFHVSMSQVRGFKDLMTTSNELVPSTDCRNIIRLIVDGDHCAVIDSIKQPHRPRTKIVRKRFQAPNDDKVIEVFYDIETCRDEETGCAIPYLICWADDRSDEVRTIHICDGKNVVERFVNTLLETYDGEEIVLLAWYGSGFDHQLVIGEMKTQGGLDEIFIKDNHILYARIEFEATSKSNDTVFHLKDPYKFISRKLAAAAESFGVLNKGEFPHDIIRSDVLEEDLSKIYESWFVLRSEIVTTSIGDHDKTKLVSSRYVKEYMKGINTDSVLQKAIEYCTIDVKCCKAIWVKFKAIIYEKFNIHVRATTMTLPQLSIEMIQALLPKGVELLIPETREDYDNFMKAQYGGRVIAKKGIYDEPCIVLDVVSEYPTVMHDYDHPYGGYAEVDEIHWDRLGIYRVGLDSTKMTQEQRNNYSEFVPLRDDEGKLQYDLKDFHEGWYCTYDLIIAKEDGFEITFIEGYEWESKGKIFAPFIDAAKVLKEKGKGAIRFVGKILLNSGYGKMGQKPIDEDVYIVKKGMAQKIIDSIEDVEGQIVLGGIVVERPTFVNLDDKWDKMIVKRKGDVRYPTQNSIFILAAARHFLRQKMMEIKQHAPNLKVIYSDTDSLIIPISSLVTKEGNVYDITPHLGKEFGKLSDEVEGQIGIRPHEVVIAGRKMYGLSYNDAEGFPRQVMRLKGVPSHLHSVDDLKFILKDTDRSVRYRMMSMKRNLTNVKVLNVIKKITQTGIFSLKK